MVLTSSLLTLCSGSTPSGAQGRLRTLHSDPFQRCSGLTLHSTLKDHSWVLRDHLGCQDSTPRPSLLSCLWDPVGFYLT